MKYWLFYAGPENYLSEDGERNFTGELVWSSAPEISPGDLALLYRRSLSKVTVQMMVEGTGMPVETAEAIKRQGIGSDIVALWQVTSGNLGPLNEWQASCQVRHLATIAPPIALKELKGMKPLRKWQDLRWNFQAQGREALEIPEFAWKILKELISARITVQLDLPG